LRVQRGRVRRRNVGMARTRKGSERVDLGLRGSVPENKALAGGAAGGEDAFLLRGMEGLDEGSAQMRECRDGLGLDLALGDGGKEAAQCGAEVAGWHVLSGEIAGDFLANLLASEDLRFPAGMEGAEIMAMAAWNAAAAAIGESERTQGHAVLWADRRHRSLLKENFWILGESRGSEAHFFTKEAYQTLVVMSIQFFACTEW
jgi:hypothetical protein